MPRGTAPAHGRAPQRATLAAAHVHLPLPLRLTCAAALRLGTWNGNGWWRAGGLLSWASLYMPPHHHFLGAEKRQHRVRLPASPSMMSAHHPPRH
eukprot:1161195-Pelagomonas_calceolata.AAC.15